MAKRLEVGDGVKIMGPDMGTLKGIVIDFCDYPDQDRILIIQTEDGKDKEFPEGSVKRIVSNKKPR